MIQFEFRIVADTICPETRRRSYTDWSILHNHRENYKL